MQADKIKLADQVIQHLQKVEDPELFVDIVNLGLIYGVDIDQGKCTVKMTLTTMGCPLNAYLDKQIKRAVLEVPGIKEVEVKLVWYPVWTVDRMSEAAKKALGVGQKQTTAKKETRKVSGQQKILDLHTPIKTLAQRYPHFVQDMDDIGFTRIKIPGMLNTVGRVMTIKLGAKAMGFNLADVKKKLEQKGYEFDD